MVVDWSGWLVEGIEGGGEEYNEEEEERRSRVETKQEQKRNKYIQWLLMCCLLFFDWDWSVILGLRSMTYGPMTATATTAIIVIKA